MSAWLRLHLQGFARSLGRLAAAPLAALANILVVGVVLALPLSAYVLVANLQSVSGALPTQPQVSVFLAPGVAAADSAALEQRLKAAPGVTGVRFISRDAALARLKNTPGMSEVVANLDGNPLPDAYVTSFAEGSADAAERLQTQLKSLPGVAQVQVDSDWVRRVDSLLRLGRSAVLLLSVLLGLALMAVTFNTIRLQILTQREEIEVAKLIGATDAFVRRPFFYWGGLLGLGGGLAALAFVWGGEMLLNRDLGGFGDFYGVALHLGFLPWVDALVFLALSAALALVGTYISVSKHLHDIEPR